MSARLLLVEDDDQIREVISDYFNAKSKGSIKITAASDGDWKETEYFWKIRDKIQKKLEIFCKIWYNGSD